MPMDLDQRIIDAGIAAMPLIADPQSWINRRVETIELLSSEETRRQVSVDFTLSDEKLKALQIADGVVVPITALTKAPRRAFDLRDESGSAVPVLGREQNGQLSLAALMFAALNAARSSDASGDMATIAAELRQIVTGMPAEAEHAYRSFLAMGEKGDEVRKAIGNDPACKAILETVWANYVLFAVLVPGGANRRVLKYAYSDHHDLAETARRLGAEHAAGTTIRERISDLWARAMLPDRHPFLIYCDGAWRARSFHVELVIPDELRFSEAMLIDADSRVPLHEDDRAANRASLYADRAISAEQSVIAAAFVGHERRGRISHAAATALAVALLLWLGVASGPDRSEADAAVSILLGGAALYSGVTAVSGESQIVSTVLRAPRRWLGIVTLASLAASASLALDVPFATLRWVWVVAAIACSLAAIRLGWSAARADA